VRQQCWQAPVEPVAEAGEAPNTVFAIDLSKQECFLLREFFALQREAGAISRWLSLGHSCLANSTHQTVAV